MKPTHSILWQRYRAEFPVRNRCIFLDHAAVAPLPARTVRALQELAEDMGRWGGAAWSTWAAALKQARHRAAQLLHCRPDDIALVKNTSHGLLIAAGSIPWREGDNIVAPAHEFPANVYPWMSLGRRGVALRLVEPTGVHVSASDLLAACDGRTRAVAVSWVQFHSGYRIDLPALVEECRRRDIYLIVDAIQGLGAVPWPLEEPGAHFIAADGHKWMLSVEGCGVLYVDPSIIDELEPVNIGWQSMCEPEDFLRYDWRPVATARRFEEGSWNMLGARALSESLGLLLEVGIERVWKAIGHLTARAVEGMERLGARLVSPRDEDHGSGIVAFELPWADPSELERRLWEHYRICVSARAGMLRIAPHFYNAPEEIDALVNAVAESKRG